MRLIDRDALNRAIAESRISLHTMRLKMRVSDILLIMKSMPTIDAVPVVRCKDCRYSEPMALHGVTKFGSAALNCTQCRGDDGYGYAGISAIYPDDYCSDGAPKED